MSLERSRVPSFLRNSFETVTANENHNTRNGMLVCIVWLGCCVLILTVWIKLLKSRMEVQNKVSRSHIFSLARHFQKLDQTLGLCFQPPEKKKGEEIPCQYLVQALYWTFPVFARRQRRGSQICCRGTFALCDITKGSFPQSVFWPSLSEKCSRQQE